MIRRRFDTLSPAERKVARALLSDYPMAGLKTIAELAASASVSSPTVIRFVTRLGFERYPDFHLHLKGEVAARITSPFASLSAGMPRNGDLKLPESHLSVVNEALQTTFRSLPEKELSTAISLLSDAGRRVVCTGGMFSCAIAYHLAAHLRQVRPRVAYVGNDAPERAERIVDFNSRTVVVICDFRRYEKALIAFAREAARRRVAIILITDPYLSPIASMARCVLPCQVLSVSPFDSSVSAFALAEMLVSAVVRACGPDVAERMRQIEETRAGFFES